MSFIPDHSLQELKYFWRGYRGQCGAVDSIKGGLIHGDIIYWFLKACFEALRLAFHCHHFGFKELDVTWWGRFDCESARISGIILLFET